MTGPETAPEIFSAGAATSSAAAIELGEPGPHSRLRFCEPAERGQFAHRIAEQRRHRKSRIEPAPAHLREAAQIVHRIGAGEGDGEMDVRALRDKNRLAIRRQKLGGEARADAGRLDHGGGCAARPEPFKEPQSFPRTVSRQESAAAFGEIESERTQRQWLSQRKGVAGRAQQT